MTIITMSEYCDTFANKFKEREWSVCYEYNDKETNIEYKKIEQCREERYGEIIEDFENYLIQVLSILHTYNWYVNTNGVNINDEDELIEHLLGEIEEEQNEFDEESILDVSEEESEIEEEESEIEEEESDFDEEESILGEWMSDEESILSDDEFRSIVCRLFD